MTADKTDKLEQQELDDAEFGLDDADMGLDDAEVEVDDAELPPLLTGPLAPEWDRENLSLHFEKHGEEEGYDYEFQYVNATTDNVLHGIPHVQQQHGEERLLYKGEDSSVTSTSLDGKTIYTTFTPTDPVTGEINTDEYVESKVNPNMPSVDELLEVAEVPVEYSSELDDILATENPDEVGPDISTDDDTLDDDAQIVEETVSVQGVR